MEGRALFIFPFGRVFAQGVWGKMDPLQALLMEHDTGYKYLFSFALMVADLIRGFVPEDWVADRDFASLEPVKTGYVSDDLRTREDDIWRLRFRGE